MKNNILNEARKGWWSTPWIIQNNYAVSNGISSEENDTAYGILSDVQEDDVQHATEGEDDVDSDLLQENACEWFYYRQEQ